MKKIFFAIFLCLLTFKANAIEEISLPKEENLQSEQTKEENKIFSLQVIEDSPYLFGDVFGIRSSLEEEGVNIQSSYIINSFVMSNRSNRSTKGTYTGLFTLSAELDSEKMDLYKGGKLFISYQIGNSGYNAINFLNSYSDINSYDSPRSINQLSELYYEHSFKDDLFNLKIGKQDANVDFQALDTGFNFLNLSFSFIPNTPMPLFPSQQMGVRARLKLSKDFYIQNGFYDGNLGIGSNPKSFFTGENDYFNITEGYKLTNINNKPGKYLVGGWIKTGDYDNFEENSVKKNNFGIYCGFEQKILNWFKDSSGGINIFGQFGYARQHINDVPYYASIGTTINGITTKRKADSIGMAFNWHQFDKELRNLEDRTSEKVVELFYKIQLTKFLYIQPDFQLILKPGGNERNSFAIGLRTGVNF